MTARQELGLKQHPLSAAFPSMPKQEVEALALDIEKHGQREPGVLLDGQVLDGWHRYLACNKAGVDFKAVEFDGKDPIAFVISRNAHRRHLTASQRAHAVAACGEWRKRGGDQSAPGALCSKTDAELAEQAGVSERTVEQAKAAIRAGLGEEVKAGKVSAKRAAEVAKLPESKRERALEGPAPKKDDPRDAEIKLLQVALGESQEKLEELADVARELNDKLQAFETTEPDEQQKLIAELQLKLRRKEAEIDRLRMQIRDANNKNNELIRTVKRLQKNGR